jgi:hypothetical protein
MKRQQYLSLVPLFLLTVVLVNVFARAEPSIQSPAAFASSPILLLPIIRRAPPGPILLPIIRRAATLPLFVGLVSQWDGEGYIRTDEVFDVGYHISRTLDAWTDADIVRCRTRQWYDPNPAGWPVATWNSYDSVSTGDFRSSSQPGDPDWKWDHWWIVPNGVQFRAGTTVQVGGQDFRVTGPHAGYSAFGQAIQYWRLENTARFKYWDAGGDWTAYVLPGDAVLYYDAGHTRLLLHRDVLRVFYYKGKRTSETAQYIYNLTASTAFPGSDSVAAKPLHRPPTGNSEPIARPSDWPPPPAEAFRAP